jgi:glycosyltransferase involved in cell wall biosynthesis
LLPRVAFLLPSPRIGGGVVVVLQYAHRLQEKGYDVTILTANDEEDCGWFPYQIPRVVPFSKARGEMFDVLFATFWTTATQVHKIQAGKRFYLIQSEESRFYPGDEQLQKAALETYRYDLEFITIARWMQDWLKEHFGRESHYLPNGVDPTIFHPATPIEPKGKKVRVLLEGPIDVPFKGMKNAFQAVKDLDCEVWCISSSGKPKPGWRCDRFFDKVPHAEMKHIYSSCDIFLKMSEVECFFLPPLEMMACGQGACVIGEVTGTDEYVEDGVNALLVKKGDVEAARRAVQSLIEDADLRNRLTLNGLKTAERFDWNATTDRLHSIICSHGYEAATDLVKKKAA